MGVYVHTLTTTHSKQYLFTVSLINDLVLVRDLCPVTDVVQSVEVDLRADESLRSLLLRGSHHLLGTGDVLAAGQGSYLATCNLLLVDIHSL